MATETTPATTHLYTREECIDHCRKWSDVADTEMQKDLVAWIAFYLRNKDEI